MKTEELKTATMPELRLVRLWLYWSIRSAASMVKGNRRQTMWSFISQLCGTGSTTAHYIAIQFDIDPFQTVSEFLKSRPKAGKSPSKNLTDDL